MLALAVAARGDEEPAARLVRVTAYCPGPCCCGRWADGRTASGSRADHPLVAAPRHIPFGTRLRVPGYAGGAAVLVEDRGGAIRGRRLDVLFPTHAEALAWGVRWLEVETD
jgi:3D (Asp-Asp-Asp) domain-containing protein